MTESKEEELLDESNAINMQNSSSCQLIQATTEQLPQQISLKDVRKVSPAALAYLGDAVYELHMRMFYLLPPQRVESYHRLVVAQVRAETQAKMLRSLTPYLRDTELEIVRRGRNASTKSPKRLEREIYQQATSLETLIGYLYLTDSQRLTELLQKLQLEKS